MRNIDRPKSHLGLDFEENLEGFIQFLNWLSVIPYTPAITGIASVGAGVMLRVVRFKVAGVIIAILVAVNWTSLRWLEHRLLAPAEKQEHDAAWRRCLLDRS